VRERVLLDLVITSKLSHIQADAVPLEYSILERLHFLSRDHFRLS
jgi:hypothetical protein